MKKQIGKFISLFFCLVYVSDNFRKLGEMALLEPLVGQALTDLSYHYIYAHIQKNSKDNYESFIVHLEKVK